MDWEQFRRPDGTLDLMAAWNAYPETSGAAYRRAKWMLEEVEELQPIHSRQLAALALATAHAISHMQEG